MEPQTELERLTVIMAKYGNNPEDTQAINYAILMQDEAAIDLLLKYGAMPGQSSLGYARRAGSLDLLKKIFATGVPFDCESSYGLIYNAITAHQNDIAIYVIEKALELGKYVSHRASENLSHCARVGNLEIYSFLSSKGFEKVNNSFLSALFGSYRPENLDKKLEMVEYLLDHNMLDINPVGGKSDTYPVLFMVADPKIGIYGLRVLRMLLEHGANANVISNHNQANVLTGENILVGFLGSGNEADEPFNIRKEMIQLLVDYGADINHKDSTGRTPLKYVKDPRMIEFLKSLGAE